MDREGKESTRRVEPHGLLVETPVWYVLARDVEKAAPRTFRPAHPAGPVQFFAGCSPAPRSLRAVEVRSYHADRSLRDGRLPWHPRPR
jgi:hypothetical protein